MDEPVVTREYREDLGEQDADGFYDYAYRYWNYWFDFGDRHYRARIYVDSQDEANVMQVDGPKDERYADDLQTIAAHLRGTAGVRTILTLSPLGGFEPELFLCD